ncbi:transmembrane protein 104 isoform X3 [Homo sapiens]|uniref:transmembrane protein 104 isoform X3 n=1 Tax=Homo sapiens TaxID=9606 RepID=UPI0023DFA0CE|nr:transmembrane protein 104 isoform X3 [Homo sapiens]
MAGEITETGELYSSYVGLVYMFNLIVGTGALTMPKAFATAGWLVSLVLLVFLGFMSFMTTTFVIEAMAAANAQLHWKRMENLKEEEDDDSSTASDSDVLIRDNYERAEKRPILSVQRRGSPNPFEITDRVEMGQMASMFFNKVGVNLFYFCIIVYLYGDLAIYAAAVPFSLMQVTCSATGNDSCGVEADTKYNDTDRCWGPLRRVDAYRIYLKVIWKRFLLCLPRNAPETHTHGENPCYSNCLQGWPVCSIMITYKKGDASTSSSQWPPKALDLHQWKIPTPLLVPDDPCPYPVLPGAADMSHFPPFLPWRSHRAGCWGVEVP